MPKLEHQVLSQTLKNPTRIAFFYNDGFSTDVATKNADGLREQLNGARIKFTAIDHQPPIEILVEQEDLKQVKKLIKSGNIKLPTVFETWASK